MDSKITKDKLTLLKELMWLRSKINFDFIFKNTIYTNSDIKRYYKKTKYILYRLAADSKDGYMHIGISDDGICEKHKNYQTYHVDKLDELIKKISVNKFWN